MKKNIHNFSVLGSVLTLAVIGGSTAFALPSSANVHAQSGTSTTSTDSTTATSAGASKASAAQANAQTHLAMAQLKACQNRETAITNIMARISDRGQKQLTLFSSIATRTETFYTTKGKTLSTYQSLVADVNAKETAAQTAVGAIKSDGTGFSCDGTDPKGFVTSFQASLKSEIAALQAYRTAVKNLIVGVKSVQATTSSSSATQSTDTTTGGAQ